MSSGRLRIYAALLISAAGVLTYANSLWGPFVLDDGASVVTNASIRDWRNVARVLSPPANTPVGGRPLLNASFALNYAIGGLDVVGYHVVNIVLHVLCGVLAFALLGRVLALPRARAAVHGDPQWVAFAIALMWTVHPLTSEVVDYITQRSESLVALFVLLTLYASVRALASSRNAMWTILAVVSFVVGIGTKESIAVVLPLLVLLDRLLIFDSWSAVLERRRWLYAGLGAGCVLLGLVIAAGPRAAVVGFGSGVSPWTYLLNQAVIITDYLRLTLLPRDLVAFYGWPAPLTFTEVMPYFGFIAILGLATLVALVRVPALGFLGAWFFVTLAPASSIVPVSTEVGAERRMYLPLLAIVTLLVLMACWIWSRVIGRETSRRDRGAHAVWGQGTLVAGVALMASTMTLSASTWQRNREYASELALARTIVERRPTAVARHFFGEQLVVAGREAEGIAQLRQAVREGNSRAGYALGLALISRGETSEGVATLETFAGTFNPPRRLVPRWLEPPASEVLIARTAMARVFSDQRDWEKVAAQAEQILRLARGNTDALGFLAAAAFGRGQFDEARTRYGEYLARRPDDASAWTSYGVTLIAAERLPDAIQAFRRAVQTDPALAVGRRLLALALLDSGDAAGARAEAAAAIALDPNDAVARDVLRRAREGQGP